MYTQRVRQKERRGREREREGRENFNCSDFVLKFGLPLRVLRTSLRGLFLRSPASGAIGRAMSGSWTVINIDTSAHVPASSAADSGAAAAAPSVAAEHGGGMAAASVAAEHGGDMGHTQASGGPTEEGSRAGVAAGSATADASAHVPTDAVAASGIAAVTPSVAAEHGGVWRPPPGRP